MINDLDQICNEHLKTPITSLSIGVYLWFFSLVNFEKVSINQLSMNDDACTNGNFR